MLLQVHVHRRASLRMSGLITGRNEVSAKVIFSQVCVMNSVHRGGGVSAPNFRGGCLLQIFRGWGGGGCLLQIFRGGACSKFSGGGVPAPNFRGGVCSKFGGVPAPNFRGGGVCSKFSGGSSNFRNTVTVRPVRILLECILVYHYIYLCSAICYHK